MFSFNLGCLFESGCRGKPAESPLAKGGDEAAPARVRGEEPGSVEAVTEHGILEERDRRDVTGHEARKRPRIPQRRARGVGDDEEHAQAEDGRECDGERPASRVQPPSQDHVEREAGVDDGEEEMNTQDEVAREHGREWHQEGCPPVGERGPAEEGDAPMGVKFGGCGTSLNTAARRTATIKKAGRGEESEGAIGRSAAILSSRHFLTFLPVRAEGCRTGKAGRTPHARIMPDLPRARSGAPLASLDGQVFWLTATIDPRAAFPRRSRRSDILPRPLADYSSGPGRILTGFPFHPPAKAGGTRQYLGAYPIAWTPASQITRPARAARRMELALLGEAALDLGREVLVTLRLAVEIVSPLAALPLNDRHSNPQAAFRWRMMEA